MLPLASVIGRAINAIEPWHNHRGARGWSQLRLTAPPAELALIIDVDEVGQVDCAAAVALPMLS